MELVDECDKNKDGKIDFEEFEDMGKGYTWYNFCMTHSYTSKCKKLKRKYQWPRTIWFRSENSSRSMTRMRTTAYQWTSSCSYSKNSVTKSPLFPPYVSHILCHWTNHKHYRSQTAQVASQQGKYIGSLFTRIARHRRDFEASLTPQEVRDESVSKPFKYFHLGSLAYIGNSAVFDFGKFSLMGGLGAMYAWRSVYWNEQVSARTRSLLMIDWIVRWVFCYSIVGLWVLMACFLCGSSGIWGRDLSRLWDTPWIGYLYGYTSAYLTISKTLDHCVPLPPPYDLPVALAVQ